MLKKSDLEWAVFDCRNITIGTLAVSAFLSTSSFAFAAAKPPAKTTPAGNPEVSIPQGPSYTTPNPTRDVVVLPVGTSAFRMPNGVAVNLAAELNTIAETAVSQSAQFQPVRGDWTSPCQDHLELESVVTIFAMEVAEVGIKFGYNPSGAISVPMDIGGVANVKIGTIAMDFHLWKCEKGKCTLVSSSVADQLTAGASANFKVDFSQIRTSADLAYKTPLGNAIRAIMMEGINVISGDPRVAELPWRAEVKDYDPQLGSVIFDSGAQSRIEPDQTFEVYAPAKTVVNGSCDVYQVVAYIHTTRVDSVSSTALVDQVFGSRGIFPGDVVMIRFSAKAKPKTRTLASQSRKDPLDVID